MNRVAWILVFVFAATVPALASEPREFSWDVSKDATASRLYIRKDLRYRWTRVAEQPSTPGKRVTFSVIQPTGRHYWNACDVTPKGEVCRAVWMLEAK